MAFLRYDVIFVLVTLLIAYLACIEATTDSAIGTLANAARGTATKPKKTATRPDAQLRSKLKSGQKVDTINKRVKLDCAGVKNGKAFLDKCDKSRCVGGNTTLKSLKTCGTCPGDDNEMVQVSIKVNDKTRKVCMKKGQTEADFINERFCDGVIGSKAYFKCPDVCVGGNTGIYPRNLTARCQDCKGVVRGKAYRKMGKCIDSDAEIDDKPFIAITPDLISQHALNNGGWLLWRARGLTKKALTAGNTVAPTLQNGAKGASNISIVNTKRYKEKMAIRTQVNGVDLSDKASIKLVGHVSGIDALKGVHSNAVTVYGDLDVDQLECDGCGTPPTINTDDPLKIITIKGSGFDVCKKSIQAIMLVNPSVIQAARQKCQKGTRCQQIKVEQLMTLKALRDRQAKASSSSKTPVKTSSNNKAEKSRGSSIPVKSTDKAAKPAKGISAKVSPARTDSKLNVIHRGQNTKMQKYIRLPTEYVDETTAQVKIPWLKMVKGPVTLDIVLVCQPPKLEAEISNGMKVQLHIGSSPPPSIVRTKRSQDLKKITIKFNQPIKERGTIIDKKKYCTELLAQKTMDLIGAKSKCRVVNDALEITTDKFVPFNGRLSLKPNTLIGKHMAKDEAKDKDTVSTADASLDDSANDVKLMIDWVRNPTVMTDCKGISLMVASKGVPTKWVNYKWTVESTTTITPLQEKLLSNNKRNGVKLSSKHIDAAGTYTFGVYAYLKNDDTIRSETIYHNVTKSDADSSYGLQIISMHKGSRAIKAGAYETLQYTAKVIPPCKRQTRPKISYDWTINPSVPHMNAAKTHPRLSLPGYCMTEGMLYNVTAQVPSVKAVDSIMVYREVESPKAQLHVRKYVSLSEPVRIMGSGKKNALRIKKRCNSEFDPNANIMFRYTCNEVESGSVCQDSDGGVLHDSWNGLGMTKLEVPAGSFHTIGEYMISLEVSSGDYNDSTSTIVNVMDTSVPKIDLQVKRVTADSVLIRAVVQHNDQLFLRWDWDQTDLDINEACMHVENDKPQKMPRKVISILCKKTLESCRQDTSAYTFVLTGEVVSSALANDISDDTDTSTVETISESIEVETKCLPTVSTITAEPADNTTTPSANTCFNLAVTGSNLNRCKFFLRNVNKAGNNRRHKLGESSTMSMDCVKLARSGKIEAKCWSAEKTKPMNMSTGDIVIEDITDTSAVVTDLIGSAVNASADGDQESLISNIATISAVLEEKSDSAKDVDISGINEAIVDVLETNNVCEEVSCLTENALPILEVIPEKALQEDKILKELEDLRLIDNEKKDNTNVRRKRSVEEDDIVELDIADIETKITIDAKLWIGKTSSNSKNDITKTANDIIKTLHETIYSDMCLKSDVGESYAAVSDLSLLYTEMNNLDQEPVIAIDCSASVDASCDKNPIVNVVNNISLSADLVSKYNSWNCGGASNCDGVCIVLTQFTNQYDDLRTATGSGAKPTHSEVLNFELVNPYSGAIMSQNFTKMSEGIRFDLPIVGSTAGKTNLKCLAWSDGAWDSSSCQTVDTSDTHVTCHCDAPGFFGYGEASSASKSGATTSKPDSGAAVNNGVLYLFLLVPLVLMQFL